MTGTNAGVIDTTKGAKVYERVLLSVCPGSMGDDVLANELRATYWAANGLQHFRKDHPLAALRPILEAHQDRLWAEYKKRFGHGEKWPGRPGSAPDDGMLTPAGWRNAYCTSDAIRTEPLDELRLTARAHRNFTGMKHLDPLVTLQSAELVPAIREYLVLVKAEITRRERRRGRKAA